MSVAVPVIDSYDGAARRIYLKQGLEAFHWIDDIYREYIHHRFMDDVFQKWFPFMKASGNEAKGGGTYTPRYITLLQGTRVIPYDEKILITVTGEAITDNADVDPDPFDTSTRVNPLKLYLTPPAAEIVVVSSGSGLSSEEHDHLMVLPDSSSNAGAVWNHAAALNLLLDVAFIKDIEGGRWIIENNQMIFYAEDNTAEVARFDLSDATGNPAMTNVMERVRA